MTEKCAGCKSETKPLRECADGVFRCKACRGLWLEKVHSTPVKSVPASVGEQSRFA